MNKKFKVTSLMSSSYCLVSFCVFSVDCIGEDKRRLQLNSSWTCNTDSDWEEESNCSFPAAALIACSVLCFCLVFQLYSSPCILLYSLAFLLYCIPLSRCPLLLYLLLFSCLHCLFLQVCCWRNSVASRNKKHLLLHLPPCFAWQSVSVFSLSVFVSPIFDKIILWTRKETYIFMIYLWTPGQRWSSDSLVFTSNERCCRDRLWRDHLIHSLFTSTTHILRLTDQDLDQTAKQLVIPFCSHDGHLPRVILMSLYRFNNHQRNHSRPLHVDDFVSSKTGKFVPTRDCPSSSSRETCGIQSNLQS